MVTLGGKSPDWIAAAGSLRAAESGTFMHELGHNFRLRHGGFENVNCKPNYQSVMSYPLQVPYIDPDRPLDYSGDPIELGFNARYLMDVLEVITSGRVQIGLIDELSPAVLRPEGEEVYLSVIMPMRV